VPKGTAAPSADFMQTHDTSELRRQKAQLERYASACLKRGDLIEAGHTMLQVKKLGADILKAETAALTGALKKLDPLPSGDDRAFERNGHALADA